MVLAGGLALGPASYGCDDDDDGGADLPGDEAQDLPGDAPGEVEDDVFEAAEEVATDPGGEATTEATEEVVDSVELPPEVTEEVALDTPVDVEPEALPDAEPEVPPEAEAEVLPDAEPDAPGEVAADLGADGVALLSCTEFCTQDLAVCTGVNQQYNDLGTCEGLCAQFAPGQPTDSTGASLGCRQYHLGLAGGSPEAAALHCPHTGPDGGGTCVGPPLP